MDDSILESIKIVLGVDPQYEAFDSEIIMAINSALMALTQLGLEFGGCVIECLRDVRVGRRVEQNPRLDTDIAPDRFQILSRTQNIGPSSRFVGYLEPLGWPESQLCQGHQS